VRRVAQSKTVHEQRKVTDDQTGRLSSDSHAGTCCLGRGFAVVNFTNEVVDVRAFTDILPAITDIPIVSAVTAYDNPTTGTTTLLYIHQALWMGEGHTESLLCPNQLRANGIHTDDIPKQFSNGTSLYGIKDPESSITIPFQLEGSTSFVAICTPQPWEYGTCQEVHLTNQARWTPHTLHLLFSDAPYHVASTTTLDVCDNLTHHAIHSVATAISQDSTLL
jgi:hypothetical protein